MAGLAGGGSGPAVPLVENLVAWGRLEGPQGPREVHVERFVGFRQGCRNEPRPGSLCAQMPDIPGLAKAFKQRTPSACDFPKTVVPALLYYNCGRWVKQFFLRAGPKRGEGQGNGGHCIDGWRLWSQLSPGFGGRRPGGVCVVFVRSPGRDLLFWGRVQ